MRGESHRSLGRYLAKSYLNHLPRPYVRAFLLGCIEPDRNPVTYLKGSIRSQWLRGHNYGNAVCYMRRISQRLERKENLNMLDYYTLGKLIHYTTDAFTYAHNVQFPSQLDEHREYEAQLQNHFLTYLKSEPPNASAESDSVMDAIRAFHREYIRQPADIRTDAQFALKACCCVLALLITPRIL